MTAESHSAHCQRIPSRPRPISPVPRDREDLRRQIERNRMSRHSAEEIEVLRKRLAEIETRQKSQEDSPRHVSTSGNVTVEADSPLAPELTAEALPAKVKIPQIGMYDGTSDPDAHLGHYTSWMELHGASDALRCRMFSLTLGPRAQKCRLLFKNSSMSVPSFDFSVKENKTESDAKKKNKKNFGKAQYRNYSKGYESTPESRAARDQYADNVRTGYQTVYSAGAATIFKELKGNGIIPDPKPVRTSEDKLDKSRYCAYHKSPGHNTDECLDLLSALLRLIGQPQLQKLINFDNRQKGRP
ncbi:Unknown protein, partial [Striga hermonthica]